LHTSAYSACGIFIILSLTCWLSNYSIGHYFSDHPMRLGGDKTE